MTTIIIVLIGSFIILGSIFLHISFQPKNSSREESVELEKFEVGDRVQYITEYVYDKNKGKIGIVESSNNNIRFYIVKFDDGTVDEVGYRGILVKV